LALASGIWTSYLARNSSKCRLVLLATPLGDEILGDPVAHLGE
jgi:hypothetical protein